MDRQIIEYAYVLQSYGIQRILHEFVFIGIDFDACRGYRRPPAGSPGAPREPSGGILLYLINMLKIIKSGQCHFETSWTRIVVLLMVLSPFLKSHNEAQFEPCCKCALFIIHLRWKLLCKIIDFQ